MKDPTYSGACALEAAAIRKRARDQERTQASGEIYRLRKRIDQLTVANRTLNEEISRQRRLIGQLRRNVTRETTG